MLARDWRRLRRAWSFTRRWWPVARWGVGLLLGGLVLWLLAGQRDELNGTGRFLARLRWEWLVVAVVAEAVSYLSFAALQRTLLGCGRVATRSGRMVGVTLASNAMQNSLPAGTAFAAAFVYRQYRRLGADELLAGWSVVALGGLSFVTIAALAAVGLVLAFGAGSALDLVQSICGTAAAAIAVVLVWTKRGWVFDRSVWLVRAAQRVTGYPRGDAAELVARTRERLGAVAPDGWSWLRALACAAGNWVFDLGCLTIGFVAVGAGVPWHGLLLAYAAAQLAAILPITPGGLGVVEGSLTVALVAFGGAEASAVAAVLVYRVISFWSELPIGWAAWGLIGRLRAVPAVEPAPLAGLETDTGGGW